MQKIAIYSSLSDVMKRFLNYLQIHRYKNISVNYSENKITAERKESLFRKDNFQFKIVPVNNSVTNIEMKIHPEHETPTSSDLEKESTLAERIYSYF